MPTLSDEDVQDGYVAKCLSILEAWPNNYSTQDRLVLFRKAIRSVEMRVPMPSIIANEKYASMDMGAFHKETWSMDVSQLLLAVEVHEDNFKKQFILLCASIYHEMRHAEQFYRILQGAAAGYFTIPKKNILDVYDPQSFKHLAEGFKVPMHIARDAFFSKGAYPRKLHDSVVRGCYRSIYTFQAKDRTDTINAVFQHVAGAYEKYRNLPEEVDAFRQGDCITQKLDAQIVVGNS